jgi:hypothetical protein
MIYENIFSLRISSVSTFKRLCYQHSRPNTALGTDGKAGDIKLGSCRIALTTLFSLSRSFELGVASEDASLSKHTLLELFWRIFFTITFILLRSSELGVAPVDAKLAER